MTKKYLVTQTFDCMPDGEWYFDTEEEAKAFLERKQQELKGRYKTYAHYGGEVEV